MSTLITITPPLVEPVSLIEAKAQLRVDGTQDDTLITSLITAARQVAESLLGRAMITQTLKYISDTTPCDVFVLPRAPLQAVSFIKTYDDADVVTTLSSALYMVDSSSSRVALRNTASLPSVGRVLNCFEVQYIAGYGDTAASVPLGLRQGLPAHIAHLYNFRGDALAREGISEAMTAIPRPALALYAPYRILPGIS